MIVTILGISIFLMVAMYSTIHALGLWLALLITHGVFVLFLGDVAIHLPLYSGITVTLVILIRRQWGGVNQNTLVLFGALILVMMLTSVFGMDVDRSMVAMLHYGKAFMLALLVAGCVKSEEDMKVMMVYCLIALIIGALVTIYQYQTNTFSISNIYKQRAAGLRGDPNDTAMLLVAGVPIAVYWYYNSKKNFYKILSIVSIPLLLIGIVLTASRSGFLTLILVSSIIYFRKPTIQLTAIGVFLVLIFLVMTPQSYWDRMNTLAFKGEGAGQYDRSISSRATLLKQGVVIFINNPVIGVGPGNFSLAFFKSRSAGSLNLQQSKPDIAVSSREKAVAHNMYVEFFAENGLIGGALFIIILYQSISNLWRYDKSVQTRKKSISIGFSLALLLGALLFSGLFLSQAKNSVLWFIIGLGFAVKQISKRNSRLLDDVKTGSESNI